MRTDFRPDFDAVARLTDETRPRDQLLEQYRLEKKLAERLKTSSKARRSSLYRDVYEELFASLPHHPQHTAKLRNDDYIDIQRAVLTKLVPGGTVFAEIGAGDARLTIAMAGHCSQVVAFDVTADMLVAARPDNFRFIRTGGTNLDLPGASVDFVYSNQLMEHLHPDDAADQLDEIVRILRPGGTYFCITPNVHSGPHDISKFFDTHATGFHLEEYSYGSLARKLRASGFRSVRPLLVRKGSFVKIPLGAGQAIEACVAGLDRIAGGSLRWNPKVRALLGINMLAVR